MNKRVFLSVILILLLLVGCGEETATTETADENPNRVTVYFLNKDDYTLDEMHFYCQNIKDSSLAAEELTGQLFTRTDWNKEYTLPLADFLNYQGYELSEDGIFRLKMDMTYLEENKAIETLCKAAIVKTLSQIPAVSRVEFTFNNLTVNDANAEDAVVVESYRGEDFVISSKSGGIVQDGVINIYFADESGQGLRRYGKSVQISNNVSIEQLVIDSLIAGPERNGYKSTIPEGTALNKISVKDQTAYVDFSAEFNGSVEKIGSDITIYSVVNSLCELATINKVQILINGERQEIYRETVDISNVLERNTDYIVTEE